MLETLVENQIIFYAMGAGAAIGVLSKLIAHFTLRRMVKAASRMSKSNHKLMRLVRAKFEQYVYEYRVFGIRLHTFRNLEKKTIWIVAVLGTAGTVAVYYLYGLEEQVFQYAAWTGIGAVILCMVHILSDENYYQQMAENYMIDYLENVCAHRYAKLYKEKNVSQTSVLEMEETFQPEAEEEPVSEQEQVYAMEREEPAKEEKDAVEEKRLQEVQVRRILEEFLA